MHAWPGKGHIKCNKAVVPLRKAVGRTGEDVPKDKCIGRFRSVVVYTICMCLSVTGVCRRQLCAYGLYGLEGEGEK